MTYIDAMCHSPPSGSQGMDGSPSVHGLLASGSLVEKTKPCRCSLPAGIGEELISSFCPPLLLHITHTAALQPASLSFFLRLRHFPSIFFFLFSLPLRRKAGKRGRGNLQDSRDRSILSGRPSRSFVPHSVLHSSSSLTEGPTFSLLHSPAEASTDSSTSSSTSSGILLRHSHAAAKMLRHPPGPDPDARFADALWHVRPTTAQLCSPPCRILENSTDAVSLGYWLTAYNESRRQPFFDSPGLSCADGWMGLC
ncbi:hypothetical protein L249_2618, partial [Ophiocordyceps polyrhachis-furcata BCC 54312]